MTKYLKHLTKNLLNFKTIRKYSFENQIKTTKYVYSFKVLIDEEKTHDESLLIHH